MSFSDQELRDILPELRAYTRSRVFAEADADDLAQQTALRMLERREQYRPGTKLVAWAITIARNLHNDEWRSTKRRGNPIDINEPSVAETLADPIAQITVESRLEMNTAHNALHNLPEEQREVLLMHGFGHGYQEIADSLDIPIGTVMSRLSRGRLRFRELMARE